MISLCKAALSTFVYLASLHYPIFREDPQVDEYHGTLVADPYRHLEDLDSPETREWVEAENALALSYLEEIPELESIRQAIAPLFSYEKIHSFVKKGSRYFLSIRRGVENQPKIYTLEHLDEKPKLLLDPNVLSNDGTVSVTVKAPSKNGEWLAYGLAASGSDWLEVRIRNVETREDLNERLHWVKFTRIAWLPDGAGFYYCRFDAPTKGLESLGAHKIYFHQLGTKQECDRFVYASPEAGAYHVMPQVDDDGNYLLITLNKGYGLNNAIYYQRLGEDAIRPLLSDFDAEYCYIGNQGGQLLFLTNRDAPLGKLIAVDLESKAVRDLIAEKEWVLESAAIAGEKLVLNYLKNGSHSLQVHRSDGAFEKEIPLPTLGSVDLLGNSSEDELFFSFSSFLEPASIYSTAKPEPFFQSGLSIPPQNYETKQVFYPSKDGIQIPLFLSYKKGCSSDRPVYLYGYGGFGVSLTPFFSSEHLAWMEMGGVLAVANLRGGNEYGKRWHEAGMLENKQNVFDDFIAAAEWLISQKITTPSKLAIGGRSNGGLLVAACLNQRPDLFAAAIPMVGVHDMLRYHHFTIGRCWTPEYGCSEDPEQFRALYRYSPLHNIQKTAYPPTLILTSDHDDRVVPSHSYKYAAALQQAQTSDNPILLRVDPSAGHGAGNKPLAKQIEETAEKLAFLFSVLE